MITVVDPWYIIVVAGGVLVHIGAVSQGPPRYLPDPARLGPWYGGLFLDSWEEMLCACVVRRVLLFA